MNQKVVELLGYGLDVFDIVNAARQKDSDQLSKLRPAARKKLIDDIIGLGAQEQVEKDCRNEAISHRRIAEALEEQLVRAVPPVKPEGHRPSREVQAELDKLKAYLKEKAAIEKRIVAVGDMPAEPELPLASKDELESLLALQNKYISDKAKISSLTRSIDNAFTTTATLAEVEASEEYYRLKSLDEARGTKADYTEQQLDDMQQTWAIRQSLTEIGDKEVTCPKCSTTFCPGHEAPAAPAASLREIKEQRERLRKWDVDVPDYTMPDVLLSKAECNEARKAFDQLEMIQQWALERVELEEHLGKDLSDEIESIKEADRQWTSYRERLNDFNKRVDQVKTAKEALAALDVVDGDETALTTAVVEARVYEAACSVYAEQKQQFDEAVLRIKEVRKKSGDFTAGAVALAEVRAEVKAYLAPSLSRVASSLIYEMTNGKLSSVDVTEEMEIFVDGQEIGTLSGAGATVANLALRIGLGQLLVARVFPVFIGDELDSDMDAERAAATTACLTNLKDRLKQTILITHKQIESTDQVISFPVA